MAFTITEMFNGKKEYYYRCIFHYGITNSQPHSNIYSILEYACKYIINNIYIKHAKVPFPRCRSYHFFGPWSSVSPTNVECGDSSPLSEPCGDESPHSTNSSIGLNDDQGPFLTRQERT